DLAGLDPAFDAWLYEERKRVGRAAAAVAEAVLFDPPEAGFDPAVAIAAAEQLLAIDPLHEGGWRALMTAHSARGDRAAALRAYRSCVATLTEHDDSVPGPETQALAAVLRGRRAPAGSPSPPASRRKGLRIGVRSFRTLGDGAAEPLALG